MIAMTNTTETNPFASIEIPANCAYALASTAAKVEGDQVTVATFKTLNETDPCNDCPGCRAIDAECALEAAEDDLETKARAFHAARDHIGVVGRSAKQIQASKILRTSAIDYVAALLDSTGQGDVMPRALLEALKAAAVRS